MRLVTTYEGRRQDDMYYPRPVDIVLVQDMVHNTRQGTGLQHNRRGSFYEKARLKAW
jgi:hypothetical protein